MLTNKELMRVVNGYIGVSGGYLGDFSYRTHAEFYPMYCDLDIDPYQYEGTTRERFIQILKSSDAPTQAKILRGVLERFPLSYFSEDVVEEKRNIRTEIEGIIGRLGAILIPLVGNPNLTIMCEVVERAIKDAQTLTQESGATSGVDRIHTALHGYLKAICRRDRIAIDDNASITQIFKELRTSHPKFTVHSGSQNHVDRIFKAISNVLDALNPLRNHASVAHPNDELLEEAEAMFVINSARTILHYINARLK